MLKIRYLLGILIIGFGAILYSCQEDDYEFGDVKSPQNLTLEVMVLNTSEEFPYGNGSGEVQITASADNAITYEFFYGDNTSEIVPPGDTILVDFIGLGDRIPKSECFNWYVLGSGTLPKNF